jgi:hypothetical protein
MAEIIGWHQSFAIITIRVASEWTMCQANLCVGPFSGERDALSWMRRFTNELHEYWREENYKARVIEQFGETVCDEDGSNEERIDPELPYTVSVIRSTVMTESRPIAQLMENDRVIEPVDDLSALLEEAPEFIIGQVASDLSCVPG